MKLTKDATGEKVDPSLYRSIIGSLLYLTASRLDIAFAIGMCAHYQANPRTFHLHSAKHILKYIIGTYDFDTSGVLVGYCDADWAGCSDDQKSTSGGCFFSLEQYSCLVHRKTKQCVLINRRSRIYSCWE